MATTYNVYRNDEKVATGLTSKSYTDSNLTPATEYTYHVTAENEHGESGASASITVTTDEPHEPPEDPAGLKSTGKTDITVDIAWT